MKLYEDMKALYKAEREQGGQVEAKTSDGRYMVDPLPWHRGYTITSGKPLSEWFHVGGRYVFDDREAATYLGRYYDAEMDIFWPVFDIGLCHPDDMSNDESGTLTGDADLDVDILTMDELAAVAWLKVELEKATRESNIARQDLLRAELLKAARRAGLDHFTLSLDGGTEVNDYIEGRWEAHYLPPADKPSVADEDTDDEALTILSLKGGEVYDGATVTNVESGAVVGFFITPETYEVLAQMFPGEDEEEES